MKFFLTIAPVLTVLVAAAQVRPEYFDMNFHRTKFSPYYFALTEKKDSLWERNAYYVSSATIANRSFYLDDSCTIQHGDYISYDIDGHLTETGVYRNGKKEGLWLGYNEQGFVVDSGRYFNDHLRGTRMKWYDNGIPRDSINFDGAGNGVQISWDEDGSFASAGYWMQDTLKTGRWKYYFPDGHLKATEDYNNGKLAVCNCYTEKGEPIDTALCREKPSKPAGTGKEWIRFIQLNLQRLVEDLASNGSKAGSYSVLVRFAVLEDGSLAEFKPLTKFGHGIEEQIIKILASGPKWEAAMSFGKPVKSYRTQPITFVIEVQ
jgi:antitoxin component YwqK of YwqJK toxin-antitoxin module